MTVDQRTPGSDVERAFTESSEAGRGKLPGSGALVPAVLKTVDIIRFLNSRGGRGATAPEFARQINITRSHCHNILRTLVHCGWLQYDPVARLYHLNSTLSADVSSALVSKQYVNAIRP